MADFNWTPYLVGGAARPDAISGLQPGFSQSLQNFISDAPDHVKQQLRLTSAYRSPDRQAEILSDSLAKRAGPDAVAKWQGYVQQNNGDVVAAGAAARPWLRSIGETQWVAPPGSSNHQKGEAADFKYLDPSATQWAHENAPKYGLNFPMSNEDWHVEPAGLRSGAQSQMATSSPQPQTQATAPPAMAAAATPTPDMSQASQFDPVGHVINSVRGAFGMAAMPQTGAPVGDPVAGGQPSTPPAAAYALANPQQNATQSLFGSLAAQTPAQVPQMQAIRGPSSQQANALTSFLTSLQARKA